MKVLNTEQQNDLLDLLSKVGAEDHETSNRISYWRLELKPKRVRRKVLTDPVDTV